MSDTENASRSPSGFFIAWTGLIAIYLAYFLHVGGFEDTDFCCVANYSLFNVVYATSWFSLNFLMLCESSLGWNFFTKPIVRITTLDNHREITWGMVTIANVFFITYAVFWRAGSIYIAENYPAFVELLEKIRLSAF